MPNWLPLGKHRYYVDPEDLFVMEGHGEITLADIEQIFAVCWPIGDRLGYWLFLLDARAGVGISPQARRFIADASKDVARLSSSAVFGTGFLERTLLMFVRNGIKILRGVELPVELFKGEPEARSWLVHQRLANQATCQQRKSAPAK